MPPLKTAKRQGETITAHFSQRKNPLDEPHTHVKAKRSKSPPVFYEQEAATPQEDGQLPPVEHGAAMPQADGQALESKRVVGAVSLLHARDQRTIAHTPAHQQHVDEEELSQQLTQWGDHDDSEGQHCNDHVHGSFGLGQAVEALCQMQPMERLKHVNQLGACRHVFPRAMHSRFIHSRGVCYLARLMFDAIRRQVRHHPASPRHIVIL